MTATKVMRRPSSRRQLPYTPVQGGIANVEPKKVPFSRMDKPEYQRDLAVSHRKILGHYNPGLAGVLTLSDRTKWSPGDTTLYVLDGLQRWEAMKRIGYTSAYCVIIQTESLEQEVLLFLEANETRSAVSTTDRHVARLIAHVQPNVAIEEAAQRSGVCFDRRLSKRMPLLDSIGQVLAVFKWAEEACHVPEASLVTGLETALTATYAAWRPSTTSVRRQRGESKWITGNAVACLTLLSTAYEGAFTADELAQALRGVKLAEVEGNFGADFPHLVRQRNPKAWRMWLTYFVHYPNDDLAQKGRKKSPIRTLFGATVDDWVNNLQMNKVL